MTPIVDLYIKSRTATGQLDHLIGMEGIILDMLAEGQVLLPSEIAEKLRMPSPTVSHTIRALLDAKLIRRAKRGGNDGRWRPIAITDDGIAAHQNMLHRLAFIRGEREERDVNRAVKAMAKALRAL